MLKKYKEFYGVLRILREEHPVWETVRVKTVQYLSHGVVGQTSYSEKTNTFKIEIVRGSLEVMVDTLIHEWAHVLSWGHEHNGKWGIAYSKCYRTIFPDKEV